MTQAVPIDAVPTPCRRRRGVQIVCPRVLSNVANPAAAGKVKREALAMKGGPAMLTKAPLATVRPHLVSDDPVAG